MFWARQFSLTPVIPRKGIFCLKKNLNQVSFHRQSEQQFHHLGENKAQMTPKYVPEMHCLKCKRELGKQELMHFDQRAVIPMSLWWRAWWSTSLTWVKSGWFWKFWSTSEVLFWCSISEKKSHIRKQQPTSRFSWMKQTETRCGAFFRDWWYAKQWSEETLRIFVPETDFTPSPPS